MWISVIALALVPSPSGGIVAFSTKRREGPAEIAISTVSNVASRGSQAGSNLARQREAERQRRELEAAEIACKQFYGQARAGS